MQKKCQKSSKISKKLKIPPEKVQKLFVPPLTTLSNGRTIPISTILFNQKSFPTSKEIMYCLSRFCCFCFRAKLKLKSLHEISHDGTELLQIAQTVIPELVHAFSSLRRAFYSLCPFLAIFRTEPTLSPLQRLRNVRCENVFVPSNDH